MSILDDPRVAEIDGGYQVQNDTTGPLKVFPARPVPNGWAVFSGHATKDDFRPSYGFPGSASATAEQAIEWARTASE